MQLEQHRQLEQPRGWQSLEGSLRIPQEFFYCNMTTVIPEKNVLLEV